MLSEAKSAFIAANGIQVHYLDWGGQGPALIFLAGLGCSAHIFGALAPRFTNAFRVLGLDRRGHGDSDYPETGYDVETLTEDLHQALDALGIRRAILVGHSMAGVELCHFTALHPDRVLKLVFLDAAYDDSNPEQQAIWASNPAPKLWPKWPKDGPPTMEAYAANIRRVLPSLAAIWNLVLDEDLRHNVKIGADGKPTDKMSDAETAAIRTMLQSYTPEYSSLHVPVLSFFCTQDALDYVSAESMTREQQAQVFEYYRTRRQPYSLQQAERFKVLIPDARIVVIPNGHHYCFIKQEQFVFEEMHKFLMET